MKREGGNAKLSKGSFIISAMAEEIFTELSDVDEISLTVWFAQFGRLFEWIGTGDDSTLPESLRQHFAPPIQRTEVDARTEVDVAEVIKA